MAPPSDAAEAVQRLHAAITALDPELAPPLPADPSDEDVAALLGVLTAHTDNILHSHPVERVNITAAAYNRVLGNDRNQGEAPRPLTYERFAARLQFTGVALLTVAGRGPATMMSGCLLAAYEGAQASATCTEYLTRPGLDVKEQIPSQDREQLNAHLIKAQEHMATAREGIAMMAGYPDGAPSPDEAGTTLESQDPRITKIVDMGERAHIEFCFATPDGPRRMTGNLPLTDVAELVGLSTEERHTTLVRIIEASVDVTEAEGLTTPPG